MVVCSGKRRRCVDEWLKEIGPEEEPESRELKERGKPQKEPARE
jgi:hypothetical protein